MLLSLVFCYSCCRCPAGMPSVALRDRVRQLATLLTREIERIKTLPKVQRGTLGKGTLPSALRGLQDALDAWRQDDADDTGLTAEIDRVLRATAGDFVQHIQQVNSSVGPNHPEFGYQLNTAKVERLLAVMGEVRGLCAVYGTKLDPMSPRTPSDVGQAVFDNKAIQAPLEQEFARLQVNNANGHGPARRNGDHAAAAAEARSDDETDEDREEDEITTVRANGGNAESEDERLRTPPRKHRG
jgi:hypothetical protein